MMPTAQSMQAHRPHQGGKNLPLSCIGDLPILCEPDHLLVIKGALRLGIHPTSQPIRNIRSVAMRRRPLLQIPTPIYKPTVVEPRGAIVRLRELHPVLVRAGDRTG